MLKQGALDGIGNASRKRNVRRERLNQISCELLRIVKLTRIEQIVYLIRYFQRNCIVSSRSHSLDVGTFRSVAAAIADFIWGTSYTTNETESLKTEFCFDPSTKDLFRNTQRGLR